MRDNERFIIDLNKKRETAWQQLYEEFYPALCTYVAKLTHENVGVEDIVQECMIGLWDSSLQFPMSNLWLAGFTKQYTTGL